MSARRRYSSGFEVNGEDGLRRLLLQAPRGHSLGSAPGRVLRATGRGIGAGLAGAALSWAIIAATRLRVRPHRDRCRVRRREGRALGVARPRWMGIPGPGDGADIPGDRGGVRADDPMMPPDLAAVIAGSGGRTT